MALAGRPFRIRKEFLDDVAEQKLTAHLANLRKALLVLHSPTDDLVGIENASAIFAAAKHPKSFVSLGDADHLLSKRRDAVYVAEVIATWSERYLDMVPEPDVMPIEGVFVEETGNGKFEQAIIVGPHRYLADEGEKSWEGSGAFFVVALICTVAPLMWSGTPPVHALLTHEAALAHLVVPSLGDEAASAPC